MNYKNSCLYMIFFAIGVIVVQIALSTLFLKITWDWAIPQVFMGAVENGIIPMSLTWWQSFVLSLFMRVLIPNTIQFKQQHSK